MKDHPILFSAPMVRAILEGRKTQTRRIIKPQPVPFVQCTPDRHPTTRTEPYIDAYCGERKTPENPRGMGLDWHWWTADDRLGTKVGRCPYGQPGDRLWVRETIYIDQTPYDEGTLPKVRPADLRQEDIYYRADGECCEQIPECCCAEIDKPRWRPSIHMPRWASRITLEVTGVRVERLSDISEADAKAEGLTARTKDGTLVKYGIPDRDDLPGNDDEGWHWQEWDRDPRQAFCRLWESINGPGSWDANPWVWVVGFRHIINS